MERLILIDADTKNSAWGFGHTNMSSYLGFKRNQQFLHCRTILKFRMEDF